MPDALGPRDVLDVRFLRVKREDIAMIKFVFEAYEEVGIVRTVDRYEAVIFILIAPDFSWVAEGIIESLHTQLDFEDIPRPDHLGDDWLLQYIPGFEDVATAAASS